MHHVVRAYRFGRKECHRKIYHFLRICVSLTQLEVEFNPTHPSATKTAIQAWPEWRGKSCDSRRKRTETWARHVRACTFLFITFILSNQEGRTFEKKTFLLRSLHRQVESLRPFVGVLAMHIFTKQYHCCSYLNLITSPYCIHESYKKCSFYTTLANKST